MLLLLHILAMIGGVAVLTLLCLVGWAALLVSTNDELRQIWSGE